MEYHINIECGRLRHGYSGALKKILGEGVLLMDISIDDLFPIDCFRRHAEQCSSCATWKKEKAALILKPLDEW